ncbi:MAG: ATP-binding cassette domain-containing protein [Peptococcaceae bacterium]|jgi:ribose transport system ATP-binding protein|nr:ATP-binding cassette domain-containing protein [Peptococcaceae bacterium]
MCGIRKSFGSATVLLHVDFSVKPGEIHTLFGADGAGKSTLIYMLAGLCAPDGGEITFDGQNVSLASPAVSAQNGISALCRESGLVPNLTVADNIFLGVSRGFSGWGGAKREAARLLDEADAGFIRSDAPANSLDAAATQIVEICRAMARNSRTLLLDDPAAGISAREAERLFRLLKKLKGRGMSVVYASSRIEDALAVSDRITALKGGLSMSAVGASSPEARMLAGMAGDAVKALYPARSPHAGAPVIKAEHLRAGGAAGDISFEAREGEILGLTGLAGDGRSEVLDALMGAAPMDGGTVSIAGREAAAALPGGLANFGAACLSEEYRRRGAGGKAGLSLKKTLIETLSAMGGEFTSIAKRQANIIGQVPPRGRGAEAAPRGDRQKAALAALNAGGAKAVILDEPARGLNADTKTEIYETINAMAESGRAVILSSSDTDEIAGMCDRAIIVRNGANAGELNKNELTRAKILEYATGA